jgi:hypothetical protein
MQTRKVIDLLVIRERTELLDRSIISIGLLLHWQQLTLGQTVKFFNPGVNQGDLVNTFFPHLETGIYRLFNRNSNIVVFICL